MKTRTIVLFATALSGAALLSLPLVAAAQQGPAHGPGDRPTPEERFEALDADGDGRVSEEEFFSAPAARFTDADENGDGFLDIEEARNAGRRNQGGPLFARADSNDDGQVTREEFDAGFDDLFDTLDSDGDGVITVDEAEAHRAERGRGHAFRHRARHGGPSHE